MTDLNATMVLIKKSDGSTERVSLSELKARQTANGERGKGKGERGGENPKSQILNPKQIPNTKLQITNKFQIPNPKSETNLKSQITNTNKIPNPPPKADPPRVGKSQILNTKDKIPDTNRQKSNTIPAGGDLMMEEKLTADAGKPLASPTRVDQAEVIIKQMGFFVPPVYVNRLRSVIQLRLKDIRSRAQTKDTLTRAIGGGGLGLNAAQADKILDACEQSAMNNRPDVKKVEPLKQPVGSLPQKVAAMPVPATATPFNAYVHENIKTLKHENPSSSAAGGLRRASTDPIIQMRAGTARPMARDVEVAPKEMGPLEEIKFFTLTDLRRLASDPVEAANRLKQKFINLKEESFVLFIEGIENWRRSPLYLDYMSVVTGALAGGKKLAAAAIDKNKPSIAEINAIAQMENVLNYY